VRLFNGVDKTGFYTWIGPSKRGDKPLGKNRDPDKIFTVKNGLLHIDGAVNGGLVTEKEYESYQLVVVYRWGERSWPPDEEKARQGGILLHATGDDGAVRNHWMHSIRCEFTEGMAGTLRAVGSNPQQPISFMVTAAGRKIELGKKSEMRYRYNPKAPLTSLTGVSSPRWPTIQIGKTSRISAARTRKRNRSANGTTWSAPATEARSRSA